MSFEGKYIFYVKAVKSSVGTTYKAVGNQFDRLKGASFGANVARVDYMISPKSD